MSIFEQPSPEVQLTETQQKLVEEFKDLGPRLERLHGEKPKTAYAVLKVAISSDDLDNPRKNDNISHGASWVATEGLISYRDDEKLKYLVVPGPVGETDNRYNASDEPKVQPKLAAVRAILDELGY